MEHQQTQQKLRLIFLPVFTPKAVAKNGFAVRFNSYLCMGSNTICLSSAHVDPHLHALKEGPNIKLVLPLSRQPKFTNLGVQYQYL